MDFEQKGLFGVYVKILTVVVEGMGYWKEKINTL